MDEQPAGGLGHQSSAVAVGANPNDKNTAIAIIIPATDENTADRGFKFFIESFSLNLKS